MYAMMSASIRTEAEPKQGGDAVDFVAVVDQAIALLRQRGRLTYRISCSFNSLTSAYKRLQTNSSWANASWPMRPAAS